jgi:hypothetical protein
MISNIHPMMGINQSSCNHPLRSVSCRRRAPTAILGRRVPIENNPDKSLLTVWSNAEATVVNSTHHQNSGREAQPLKSAYLAKQIFTDSMNVMVFSLCGSSLQLLVRAPIKHDTRAEIHRILSTLLHHP